MVQTCSRMNSFGKNKQNRRAEVGPLGLITVRNRINGGQRSRSIKGLTLIVVFALLFVFTGTVALARRNGAVHISYPSQVAVTVQSGDTLWKLAHRYGDPSLYILERVDELSNENNLSSDSVLQPGQRILIPVHSAEDFSRISSRLAQH